jgi:hypothetical protein
MTFEELHQLHLQRLAESFGVANAQAAVRDDRAIRAMGDDTLEKAKVEY